MKAIVQRKVLLDKFEIAAPFAPKRSSKEVLTNVLLEVKADSMVIEATDTENGISLTAPCESLQSGKVLAPRDRMLSILRESLCDDVKIESDGTMVMVTCGSAEFNLTSRNPDEFPRLTHRESTEGECTLEFDQLHQAIMKTAFATDTESSRFALGGIPMANKDGKLSMVGNDGRRLSWVEIDCDCKLTQQLLPPAKAMRLLAATKCSGDVLISSGLAIMSVRGDTFSFFTTQVGGKFPNWQTVVPPLDRYQKATVQTVDFTRAIRQAAITQDSETKGANITVAPGSISAACSAADIGDSQAECPCEFNGTEEVKVKLDSSYVLEFLKTVDTEQTEIFVSSSTQPVVLQSASHKYVVMPMVLDQ